MPNTPKSYDIFSNFPEDRSDVAESVWALIWFMEAVGLINYEDLDEAYYKKDVSVPKYIQKYFDAQT